MRLCFLVIWKLSNYRKTAQRTDRDTEVSPIRFEISRGPNEPNLSKVAAADLGAGHLCYFIIPGANESGVLLQL